jgi:3-oxoadipate enol-lactonase
MPFVEADGAQLYYQLEGHENAPVLLLSNSLGTALEMWDPQVRAFTMRYRLLRYDSRGHGRSEVAPGPYTIERLGRDALALLDALGLQRVAFCGLSKGGMVGQWLGANAPDRVEKLVLCNTSAHIGSPEVWNQRIETVQAMGMGAIVPGVIDRWFTQPFRESAPEEVAKVRAMLESTDPEGYVACCAAVRDMDLRGAIRGIRVPTLVIAGYHDVPTPPEHARLIAESIPGAQMVTLDAAHLSNVEAQADFTKAVLDFLGG